ncbi:di-sulfide bridge nucleocytoplasmic transport domain-containing protein [Sarocladium implicatum]|nr:di-sulfide bridge nucleocytoplasmic transport domain-containing protein [Sarocladium implicatum]
MDRRTYEGHMDWEWQNGGAKDPTSPFSHTVRDNQPSIFSTPAKASARPNPFLQQSPRRPASPTKPLPPIPSSTFAPSISAKNTASPFRNPAFTTPRKPFDEQILSEQEDSPALTEASDLPNDTPEVERIGDVVMGGTITPTKVDKSSRYGRSKKHTPGRGEIRAHRDLAGGDVVRKRKRQNFDRDVSSVARRVQQDWDDSEVDSDASYVERRPRGKKQAKPKGLVGSMLHMLDEHPNAPENLYRWIQLLVNFFIVFIFVYIGWAIVDTVRSDIRTANEAARQEVMSRMTECQTQYTMNECSKKDRPALRVMCDEWYECMIQNPEAIMRVKVSAKQIAEIINEFSETMNLKAWGFFFAILIVCACANNLTLGRQSVAKASAAVPAQPSAAIHDPSMPPDAAPGFMWVPVQTPSMKRHGLLEDADGTDTDASPPRMKMLPPYTPSSRRSPSKTERGRSPIKNRSPVKAF